RRLYDKKIRVEMTFQAKEHLANIGYDEAYGARPLRRIFQKELEDYMATQMLMGAYREATIIKVDADNKKLVFQEELWEDYQPLNSLDKKEIENENLLITKEKVALLS
ncbi:MAG: hypothetical protein KDK90_28680, partial [Leptospiraceae bacterium]|nr:hypothetical protein [Leptospiraceae bacterium]